MLTAPQNKKLKELKTDDDQLDRKLSKALTTSRRDGNKRFSFVGLENGKVLRVEKLNVGNVPVRPKKSDKIRKPTLITGFFSLFGLG